MSQHFQIFIVFTGKVVFYVLIFVVLCCCIFNDKLNFTNSEYTQDAFLNLTFNVFNASYQCLKNF